MKQEIAEKLNLQSDEFKIETEITVKSLRNGFRSKEVPITIERRKCNMSKIKILADGLKILSTILQSFFQQQEQEQQFSTIFVHKS
jgi:hypothetical protein